MTARGHIYMIWTPLDNSFCYIGSTFNRLHKRFEGHKSDYKFKYGEFSIHKYYDKYGIDNFKIDLIKSYEVIREHKKDFKHLHAYETLWINKTKNCINKLLPFSPMRYFNRKNYYQQNKDKYIDYREKNKDKIKNYYEKNKYKIEEMGKVKVKCECGSLFRKSDLSRHLKTKKHQNYINNLEKKIKI